MSLHPIPPTLADIGLAVFGQDWKESLATALEVTMDQVNNWLADPARMPADLEQRLDMIGRSHVDGISFMLGRMANSGLDRSVE